MYISGNGDIYDDEEIVIPTLDNSKEVSSNLVDDSRSFDIDDLARLWEKALKI